MVPEATSKKPIELPSAFAMGAKAVAPSLVIAAECCINSAELIVLRICLVCVSITTREKPVGSRRTLPFPEITPALPAPPVILATVLFVAVLTVVTFPLLACEK